MYIDEQECRKCKKITIHHNDVCANCAGIAKQERIDKWNAMTIDEKLNDLKERVEKLENNDNILG